MLDPLLILIYAYPGLLVFATIFWVWVLVDCVSYEVLQNQSREINPLPPYKQQVLVAALLLGNA